MGNMSTLRLFLLLISIYFKLLLRIQQKQINEKNEKLSNSISVNGLYFVVTTAYDDDDDDVQISKIKKKKEKKYRK